MDFFPIFTRLDGRTCLLVGGGSVAARKARLMLRCGASLRVVAPVAGTEIRELAAAGALQWYPLEYHPRFMDGVYFVVAATGDERINARVTADADTRSVFCNSVDDLVNSSAIVPALVDRSPLVVAISSGGTAPVLARRWREKLETLLPTRLGSLAALAGRFRRQVARRLAPASARRQFWERFLDGPVAAGILAGNEPDADTELARLLQQAGDDREAQCGEAFLVGAGPGDPSLLTLRALQLMQEADVVLYDRLVSESVLELVRRDAERIAVGKAPGAQCLAQEEISALLVRLVREGKKVCRLKGGDPFVFGRGGEELTVLKRAGIRFQIVPGITAAAGCAAYAGIPLTHREHAQSVVLVTAHGKNSIDRLDWRSLARDRQTLAFYMGVGRLGEIRRQLLRHGRSARTPVAIVERGTTDDQRVVSGELGTLVEVAERHAIRAPAMLYVGEVARFAHELEWFQPRSARLSPAVERQIAHG